MVWRRKREGRGGEGYEKEEHDKEGTAGKGTTSVVPIEWTAEWL
jgi:hypothetical protein